MACPVSIPDAVRARSRSGASSIPPGDERLLAVVYAIALVRLRIDRSDAAA